MTVTSRMEVPAPPVEQSRVFADLVEMEARVRSAESKAADLERALVSNRRIGMAIGILMARRGLTEEQAFQCLRDESQRRNIKLRELAETVVYTGDL